MRQACLVIRVRSGSWGSASSPGPALPRAGMAGGAPDPGLLNGLAMVRVLWGTVETVRADHRAPNCCIVVTN